MNKINTHSGQLIKYFLKLNNHQQLHEQQQLPTNSSHDEVPNSKKHFLLLPYKGKRADNIIKSMKKTAHKMLLETVNTQLVHTIRKLSTCFQIKDKSQFDHQHDLMYHAKCPSEFCDKYYIGESGRRITKRAKDHNGRDHKSHILKHSHETGHGHVISSDFSIISKNFNGNKRKQKTAKLLLIKQLCPTLNIQNKSVPLKLFN